MLFNSPPGKIGNTAITINGKSYGAQPDKLGPIGGGAGYKKPVKKPKFTATTLEEMLAGLKKAKPGDVVFIPGDVEIDCTGMVAADELVIPVKSGVTLASDRGKDGSPGALIYSDLLGTKPLFKTKGANTRFTGLRLRGPDPNQRLDHHRRAFSEKLVDPQAHEYYYRLPMSYGIFAEHRALEVDNCELAGWSVASIALRKGRDHHIHHNYIHHNQLNGLGYGVSHTFARSLIERNLFNFNRHSIAGSGVKGSGYTACHNVELGESLSHCFDMHGGSDRKDGTNIAGSALHVHHNTFRAKARPIAVRGECQSAPIIEGNWFCHCKQPTDAIRNQGHIKIHNNAYGPRSPKVMD